MPEKKEKLLVQKDGDITRIEFLSRNVIEEADIQQIGDQISDLIDNSAIPKLLISFENVEHLSSAALGTLITVRDKVRQKGGQLRLSNIDSQIYEVFVITQLNKLFQIHDNVNAAARSFK